ncbi:MAG: NADH-quinone oxidoreductase subunit A [bacterium]
MSNEFLALVTLMVVAAVICTVLVGGTGLLGPRRITPYKDSPYECGVAPSGDANERFPIKFYLVAILFVLFDIEVIFLWGWLSIFAKASRDFQVFSFVEVLVYLSTWILGYVYAIKVGAINWDETTSLAPEKHEAVELKRKEAS